ncbi:hypothetical protein [Effusibacillus consociatus]|uniref:Bacillus phage SPbeta YonK domain-containing protein n=1 Tax=Effusibacillus consociatus TaxID=1117041 RepID=A0ABV9PY54_9BACL
MSVPKKLDQDTANEFKSIFSRLNITKNKVTVDLDNETIEIEDE